MTRLITWLIGLPLGKALKYWKEILIALLIALALYQNTSSIRYLFFLNTIPSCLQQLDKAKTDLKDAQDTIAEYKNTIDQRNKEVMQWKTVSNELEAQNQQLQIKITSMQKKTEAQVRDILNDPTPKDAQSSMNYLRDGIKDLSW